VTAGEGLAPSPRAASSSGAIGRLFRYRFLALNLALKDLKLKYRDSAIGILWSLGNPLLTLLVYTFAFRTVLKVRMDHYPFFVMVSLLPWTFFSSSLQGASLSILQSGHLVRKVSFPMEVLPIAAVLFSFAQMALAFVAFLPFFVFVLRPGPVGLLVLPILALHLLFTSGLALVLAPVTTLFRDVAHLTEVALLLVFWLTPIVYPVALVPASIAPFLRATPLAAFTIAYQDVLFFGRVPDSVVLASLLVSSALSLLLGLAVFARMSPDLPERT
jgi:ABC-type polysaccharide/polyol phosphate export permease